MTKRRYLIYKKKLLYNILYTNIIFLVIAKFKDRKLFNWWIFTFKNNLLKIICKINIQSINKVFISRK